MTWLWRKLGKVLFYASWPVWYVYFKYTPDRTRVLVTSQDKVLLVKGWLSDDRWMLPGGGSRKGEDLKLAACRETSEETGITLKPARLQRIGARRNKHLGFNYRAVFYTCELPASADIKPHFPEITAAAWFPLSEAMKLDISDETRYAFGKIPSTQQP